MINLVFLESNNIEEISIISFVYPRNCLLSISYQGDVEVFMNEVSACKIFIQKTASYQFELHGCSHKERGNITVTSRTTVTHTKNVYYFYSMEIHYVHLMEMKCKVDETNTLLNSYKFAF